MRTCFLLSKLCLGTRISSSTIFTHNRCTCHLAHKPSQIIPGISFIVVYGFWIFNGSFYLFYYLRIYLCVTSVNKYNDTEQSYPNNLMKMISALLNAKMEFFTCQAYTSLINRKVSLEKN